jgi:hypothetical protein
MFTMKCELKSTCHVRRSICSPVFNTIGNLYRCFYYFAVFFPLEIYAIKSCNNYIQVFNFHFSFDFLSSLMVKNTIRLSRNHYYYVGAFHFILPFSCKMKWRSANIYVLSQKNAYFLICKFI